MGTRDDLRSLRGVARLGLGLAALGRPGYINLGHDVDLGVDRSPEALERRTHEVLDAAYGAGVCYVDAARSYGMAEAFLGSWLRSRDVPGVIVGSKWGYVYTADWQVDATVPEVKHHDRDTLRRQLAESRDRLGNRLALYQIHSATLESGVLDDAEVLDELAALRDSGVAIGATVSGPHQAELVDRIVALGRFDAVQATWNLVERSASDALERAHAAGLAVIVKEALANGRLTSRGDAPTLDGVAVASGVNADALALAVALAQPWATIVLSGAATVDTLRQNLGALTVPPDAIVDPALDSLRESPEAYWSRRRRLPWH
jgi:aryl-alcohol dehydrogenase-like predicted oxidoreductase